MYDYWDYDPHDKDLEYRQYLLFAVLFENDKSITVIARSKREAIKKAFLMIEEATGKDYTHVYSVTDVLLCH